MTLEATTNGLEFQQTRRLPARTIETMWKWVQWFHARSAPVLVPTVSLWNTVSAFLRHADMVAKTRGSAEMPLPVESPLSA
jgi:hypothetical protein